MDQDPLSMLMNMSQGGTGGHSASSSPGTSNNGHHQYYMNEIVLHSNSSDEDDDEEDEESESDLDVKARKSKTKGKGRKPAVKRGKAKKMKGKTISGAKMSELLTFEEQQEIEEPVEIDMRNIYKSYGINPMEVNRQKSFRKQSNDIINFSIGEANLKFSHGKFEEAISLLFETIRTNPTTSQPYDALGDYYLSIGSYQKALEFFLLAIELHQNDSKRWVQLAEIADLNGMYKSAAEFYTRAIKLSPKNSTYYIKKGNLLEKSRQYENALKTYLKLLSSMEQSSDSDIKVILSIEFRVASILMEHMGQPVEALEVVEKTLEQYRIEQDPVQFASFVHLYLNSYFDLLFKNDQYFKVFLKFLQYNLVNIDSSCLPTSQEVNEEVLIDRITSNPDSIQFEVRLDTEAGSTVDANAILVLKSKFICVFIYLKKLHFAEHYLPEFESLEDSSLIEAIYPTFVEAFISVQNFEKAYQFVRKLVGIKETCSRFWYWSGLCLSKIRPADQLEAIEAFENAIIHDCNNYDAVNELSHICNLIGNPERALENVTLMERSQTSIDFQLWYNRCNLLYICKRWREFIDSAELLLSSEMYFFDNWNDIGEITHPNMCVTSLIRVSKRLYRRYAKRSTAIKLSGGRLSQEQFLDLWKKSIFVLLNYSKEYENAIRWAFSSLLSVHFEKLHLPCTLVMFRCCLDAKWQPYTYELARFLLKEHPYSGKLWYAFSVTMNDIYQDFRHKRFCMRIWKAHTNNINILMMNGHIALLNGRYRHALAIFLLVYIKSSYRYDSFYIGLCYLHMMMQNHTLDKCSLFAQMLAFFDDYVQKVGKCQETYYNLGRVYHQLGFYRHAVELYQAALYTPLKIHDKRYDLTPEIAFNLSQIYRRSGDHRRANNLITQFCTI